MKGFFTRSTRHAGCFFLGLAALAGPLNAQQVDLQFRLPAGTALQVQESQTFSLAAQASDAWGNQQQINQNFSGSVQFRMDVLSASAEGKPQHVKLAFAPNLGLTMSDGQNQQTEPFGFSGQTLEVQRKNGGFQLDPNAKLDFDSQEFLKELTEFGWQSLLPGRVVSVGESWQPDSAAYLRAAGLDQGSSVSINAKLVNVAPQNGRPTAEVDLEFQLNASTEGMPLRGTQRGKAFIDVATGVAVAVQLQGDLPLQMQGPEGSLQGKCNWVIQRQASILAGQGGPGNFGGGGFGGNTGGFGGGGFNDNTGSGGAGEVPVDDGFREEDENGVVINSNSAPPFAGTFSNGQLSVTLIEAPEDGRRTIEIVRGDIKSSGYLTGNRNVNMTVGDDNTMTVEVTFQGKFVYGDKEFDFSAKQPEHQRLLFTTGSTTHDLTLQQAEPAAEPNPFE